MNKFSLRYPGALPFETQQKDIFFGREKTSQQFYRKIKLEKLVVLHSKSGLGKSSLLNAGIIPKVLEDQRYQPIRIRFNACSNQEEGKSPLQTTQECIRGRKLSATTFLDQLIENENTIWHDVKETQLLSESEKGLLLIFDQFEELFTYSSDSIKVFAQQLVEVLSDTLPQRYWDQLEKKDLSNFSDEKLLLLQQPISIKIIIAIRSDRLSLLDKLSPHLPSILKNCFELQALDNEQAQNAIVLPAKSEGDFSSPPFEYEQEALDNIMDFLTQGKSQGIESTQLQIVCNAMERKAMAFQLERIGAEDTRDLDTLIEKYYDEKIALLETEDQQDAARKLIEDKLIFVKEQRRLSLYEGQILSEGITPESLGILVNSHLLRAEPSPQGGFTYELSHDTLVVPVLKSRQKRVAILEQQKQLEEQLKREQELEEIKENARKERAKAEEQIRLRRAADKNAKRARQRTRWATGVSALALLLFLVALGFSGKAKLEKDRAETARLELIESSKSLDKSYKDLKATEEDRQKALDKAKSAEDSLLKKTGELEFSKKQIADALESLETKNKELNKTNKDLKDQEEKTLLALADNEIARLNLENKNKELEKSQKEIQSEQKKVERLRNLDLAQKLALQSIFIKDENKKNTKAILASIAYNLNKENGGDLFNSDLFNALFSSSVALGLDPEFLSTREFGSVNSILFNQKNDAFYTVGTSGEITKYKNLDWNNLDKPKAQKIKLDLPKLNNIHNKAALSDDEKWLVIGGKLPTIIIRNLEDDRAQPEDQNLHQGEEIFDVELMGNHLVVSSGVDQTINIFDLNKKEVVHTLNTKQLATQLMVIRQLVVYGNPSGELLLWDPFSTHKKEVLLHRFDQAVTALATLKNNNDLQGVFACGYENGFIKMFQLSFSDSIPSLSLLAEKKFHDTRVADIQYDPTGKYLSSVGFDKKVMLWKMDSISKKEIESRFENPVIIDELESWGTALAFIPDENKLLVGTEDGEVKCWDIDPQSYMKYIRIKMEDAEINKQELEKYLEKELLDKFF